MNNEKRNWQCTWTEEGWDETVPDGVDDALTRGGHLSGTCRVTEFHGRGVAEVYWPPVGEPRVVAVYKTPGDALTMIPPISA